MRKLFLILLFAFSWFNASSQVFYSAQEYNNALIQNQAKISAYFTEIAQDLITNPIKADSIRKVAIIQTIGIIDFTRRMNIYDGNSSFRDAGVSIFQYYLSAFQNEYQEIVQIFIDSKGKPDETQMNRLEFLDRQLLIKEQPLDDLFIREQMKFAFENDLELMRP